MAVPIAGIMITDCFLIRRTRLDVASLYLCFANIRSARKRLIESGDG
jgi:cytosine/uracil/thiamine/allantoin permease